MLNWAEHVIRLFRQRCLHHRLYKMKMPQIEQLINAELLKRFVHAEIKVKLKF